MAESSTGRVGLRGGLAKLGAEVAVIVVGVLIALAADGWRQAVQDQRLAETYYEGLVTDLAADTTDFVRFLDARYLPAQARAADSLVVLLSDSTLNPDPATVARYVRELVFLLSAEKNRATFDDMVSSGRLGLVRDPALRTSLVRYYSSSVVDNPSAWNAFLEASFFPLTQDLARVLGGARFREILGCDWRSGPGSGSPEAYEECFRSIARGDELHLIREDERLASLINNQTFHRFFAWQGVAVAQRQATELLSLLDSVRAAP